MWKTRQEKIMLLSLYVICRNQIICIPIKTDGRRVPRQQGCKMEIRHTVSSITYER